MRENPNKSPRRRWLQFSLRTLLSVTAIAGVVAYGLHWNNLRKETLAAWNELERAWAYWDAGVATNEEIYAASKNLCEAECGVPLASKVAAYATHLARMQKFLNDYRTRLESSIHDHERAEREYDKLAAYCEEAETWLEAAQGRPLLPN